MEKPKGRNQKNEDYKEFVNLWCQLFLQLENFLSLWWQMDYGVV